MPLNEKLLWHANMPNVRIAATISGLWGQQCVHSCATRQAAGKFCQECCQDYCKGCCHDGRSLIITTQAADTGRAARARRSRGTPQGGSGQRHAGAEGASGSEGPGTDAIWRLGAQRHCFRFLRRYRLPGMADSVQAWEYAPIRKSKYLPDATSEPLASPVLGRAPLAVRVRRRRGDDATGAALGALAADGK